MVNGWVKLFIQLFSTVVDRVDLFFPLLAFFCTLALCFCLYYSFAINIGHDSENIAMHFNPRFDCHGDVNTIVFNSMSGGCWGDEHREMNFPFTRGEECKVCL